MVKNIVALAGPPCSGKTIVGEILSLLLNANFIDIDRMIERQSEHSISWIFLNQGEKAFRELEKRVIADVVSKSRERTVMALGGGALLNPQSRELVEQKTILFTLMASVATLTSRNNESRPLAGNPRVLKELLERREQHYKSLCGHTSTENKTPTEIAEIIRKEVLPLWFPQDPLF